MLGTRLGRRIGKCYVWFRSRVWIASIVVAGVTVVCYLYFSFMFWGEKWRSFLCVCTCTSGVVTGGYLLVPCALCEVVVCRHRGSSCYW
jgi:hypothetical protein